MSSSFTLAKEKFLFGIDTKMWLLFIGAIVSIFVFTNAGVFFATSILRSKADTLRSEQAQYSKLITDSTASAYDVTRDVDLVSKVAAKNKVIKDSLINIMDLVPEQIYITTLEASADSLHIKGYAPSQEIYNYLLKPQLESIFSTSSTYFVPNENGWVAFDSLSVMDNKERLFYGDEH
ncbi:hypothetical protein FACS189487_11360 [Campylobacterota bacterium]|nr:hypothetical protein FACS189487_11360 [Campylobacterota bacterium]